MNEFEWHLLDDKTPVEHLEIRGVEVRPGDRVRLQPRAGGDVMDIALAGRIATVESIEQDYEGQFHLAVVVDEDPGRDLGIARQPGHRFFFQTTEVEPMPATSVEFGKQAVKPAVQPTQILIACIGNIFLGDDAFGVEVAQRFAGRVLPKGVRLVDFGIRGFDLAYELLNAPEATILVDACPRGDKPGTLYVIEPDLAALEAPETESPVDTHGMHPLNVLRLAKSMDGKLKRILLVGCEPEELGGDEGKMGLTDTVASAVERAVPLIEMLIGMILGGDWPSGESQA